MCIVVPHLYHDSSILQEMKLVAIFRLILSFSLSKKNKEKRHNGKQFADVVNK